MVKTFYLIFKEGIILSMNIGAFSRPLTDKRKSFLYSRNSGDKFYKQGEHVKYYFFI